MRIGIDCRSLMALPHEERGGIEYYTYSLIKHLFAIDRENDYVLFFDHLVKDADRFKQPNVSVRYFPFSYYRQYLPFAYSHLLMASFLNREKLDILHSPAHTIPLLYKGKFIITIRNMSVFKHPEWFRHEYFPPVPPELFSRTLFTMKKLLPQNIKKADKVITFSKDTKRDVAKVFRIPAEKISVVYPGIDTDEQFRTTDDAEELSARFGITQPYVFFIGSIEPRKNLHGLVQAYYQLLLEHPELVRNQLLLVGEKRGGAKCDELFETIDFCNKDLEKRGIAHVREQIRYLGFVPYQDKFLFLRNAACFAYPSFYEGFCSTPLKAMEYGVPVIASRIRSLVEIADNAAYFVDPNSTGEIQSALHDVLTKKDLRERLRAAGDTHARNFSWKTSAQNTLNVYTKVFQK
ncbi:glycosyltransferase family 4 protein [Candidatus Uhrbacteria bacterium]|nr:glycosyltransferase family 4 protein [Candidatus Uhrbacteria bacterium]